jgi:hypothetical protein
MQQMVRYDAMCTAIAECYAVDEVKEIRDKAIALEAYAKQAMNTEAERKATEIRIRAERRVGQLLAEKERGEGGRPDKNSVQREPSLSEYAEAKRMAGISDTQAKRWQGLAKVPDHEFESALNDPAAKPSTSGIIKKANGEVTPMHDNALWIWGRLRDFEAKQIGTADPCFLFSEMTEAMQADVVRILPSLVAFYTELQECMDEN